MLLQTINPATGETLATYEEMTPDQVRGIIEKTHKAYLERYRLPVSAFRGNRA